MFEKGLPLLFTILLSYIIFGYVFTLTSNGYFFWLSLLMGLSLIYIAFVFSKADTVRDFSAHIPLLILLLVLLPLFVILFYVFGEDLWANSLLLVILYPVLTEEFAFRYVLQKKLLKNVFWLNAIIIQGIVYAIYYSRLLVVGGGVGFPFPYNFLMIISVLSMGLLYGFLTHATRNIYLSATIHFSIWALFPIMVVISPAAASILVPT